MDRKRFAAVMFSLIMMLAAMSAFAAEEHPADTRVIEVSGTGEARSAPDEPLIVFRF
jgi:uncharacterized protein YggE